MQSTRLEQLQEMLKNEPNDSFLRYAIATEYVKMGDKSKALEYYEMVLRDDPDYVGTYYHLGKLHEGMNKKEKAIEVYQRGMEVAQRLRNNHALSELRGVYNQLAGIDEEDEY